MNLRDEAMLMLDKRGAVMETAQRVSMLLREKNVRGAVIGGVAVVLHGYLRTTKDVDIYVADDPGVFKPILESAGASFNAATEEFVLDAVPVHLVDSTMALPAPREFLVIDDVVTVGLADLINLKLRSGTSKVSRAQDLADVIGLIRAHRLTSDFAAKLHESLRADFCKLVTAIKREG